MKARIVFVGKEAIDQTLEPTGQQKRKDHWSEDEQVFFCDGKGYGLTDTLYTICLGQEADIKKFFETGKLNKKLKPIQRQVLVEIEECRKEQGIGTTDTRAADMERAGNNGASRRKQKAARHLTARKGLSLRLSRKKSKSLPW